MEVEMIMGEACNTRCPYRAACKPITHNANGACLKADMLNTSAQKISQPRLQAHRIKAC